MSCVRARVVPHLSKALPILSDTSAKRTVAEQLELKPYCKFKKMLVSLSVYYPIFASFFRAFTKNKKEANNMLFSKP